MIEIRYINRDDISHLKKVLDSIELFPSEMLDEMIAGYFAVSDSPEIWFTALKDNQSIGIGFCAPEQLTDGTYNLYAIGVHQDIQGKGVGKQMMQFIEEDLRRKGQRILIVETSGIDAFESTRRFYTNLGYHKEAVIRDFWAEGDDKVIFWKKLKS